MHLTREWMGRAAAVVLAAGLAAACGEEPVTPTPVPGPTTFAFSSQIGVGGSATRTITFERTGDVKLMLVLIAPDDAAQVTLAVGNWDGTTCTPLASVQTGSGLEPQLIRPLVAGTYCVRVSDPGTLTQVNVFQVNVTIP